jgi:hypothetical protein
VSFSFNVILDSPPELMWRGVVQKTDFKQVLKFFRLMDDDGISEEEKAVLTIRLFFESVPDVDDLWKHLSDFISCGTEGEEEGRPVFDWNIDHGRIFAAFLETYGIDLRTASMHWWVFLQLFQALPEDCKLLKIIELRSKKPNKHDSPEYRRELRKAQQKFSIDNQNTFRAFEAAMDRW